MPKTITDVRWSSARLDPDGKLTVWIEYLDADGKDAGSATTLYHQVSEEAMKTIADMIAPVLEAHKATEGI